jgi:hypothetical protein
MVNRLRTPVRTARTVKPRYRKRTVKRPPIKINGRPSLAKGRLLLILVPSKFDEPM